MGDIYNFKKFCPFCVKETHWWESNGRYHVMGCNECGCTFDLELNQKPKERS